MTLHSLLLMGALAAEPTPVPAPAPAPAAGTAPAPAPADEEEPPPSFTGKSPPPLPREPRSAAAPGFELPDAANYQEYKDLPYPHGTYLGAKYLQLDPAFVYGVQQGLEFLYLRKYTDARDHFAKLEVAFPGTAVRAIGDTLVWQALMLENFDFRYDKQYWTSSKQAKKDVAAALDVPGTEAWDHLAMAAITGIESIHTMRQASYVSALQLAFQAIDQIEKCRAAAPDFVDLKLADGMYNYWRTVVTMSSKMLPDFGDHRPEGIEQMTLVQDQGIFMRPLASFALAFTWIEEHDYRRATIACSRNRRYYPDNVVNNLICAQIYVYDRKFPEALEVLDRVTTVDATNSRVHYLRGWALLRQGSDMPRAQAELTTFLKAEYLEQYQRSLGHYRLGQVYARQEQYPKAVENYQASVKLDGNKEAKAALEKLDARKKEGKISY